jgi:UDP-galactopyranose mutase
MAPEAHAPGRRKAPVVVLGAGPAGIAAALALGGDAILLERKSEVGGLSGSLELAGAVFDLGGHSFHTPHPRVKELVFDALEMTEQKREARCFVQGCLIPYPFQRHFRDLPSPAVVAECARGLSEATGGKDAADVEAYLRGRFGEGIAEHFLLPYNRKLWGEDLARLSPAWAAERIAAPEGSAEKFSTGGGKRRPLQDDTIVAYPARGGFGQIATALASSVEDLRLGTEVERVDPRRRRLVTARGEVLHWDRLVSTLPIPRLLDLIDEAPESLKEDAARLECLSLTLVFVVIGRPVGTKVQRIYAADSSTPFHKIVINHNSSDYLRSLPRHGIAGEMSRRARADATDDGIERLLVEALHRLGLLRSADEVVETATLDVKYGYPVPTLGREEIVERIRDWLSGLGIFSVGRFGEWAYINSDEAMHRGWTLGEALRDAAL